VAQVDFSSLSAEYQAIINEVESQHGYQLTPLQALGGGRTGALLYLVSAAQTNPAAIQHFILKLDRVKPAKRSEEIHRHQHAQENAPETFRRSHMAQLSFAVEHDTAVGLFYTIAGQSLLRYRPLSDFDRQDQLEALFRSVYETVLKKWNQSSSFQPKLHPQSLLERWLGYRITPRGNLKKFFAEGLNVSPDVASLLIDETLYPNPLAFSSNSELWGQARPLDAIHGFQHGDLNVANVLAYFGRKENRPEGMFLIDFALYKANMPMFYDLAYLEMSYLLEALNRSKLSRWWQLVQEFSKSDLIDVRSGAAELTGPSAVINAGRSVFKRWAESIHPSLQDDLWAQYWLAAVAAGLNFTNKPILESSERLAGLLFAAAHLKRYCMSFSIWLSPAAAAVQIDLPASPMLNERTLFTPASSKLPRAPDTFIGREHELAELKELLLKPEVRLVTMTGPGGTGKTRLALQLAGDLQHEYPDGAAFVSLAEIREPDLLISRIAGQFGLREGGSLSLFEILINYLRDRQLLLVLDNFEQITSASSSLVSLLDASPGSKILVTSRTLLQLRGEYEYHVPTLSLPDKLTDGNPEVVIQSEAVQLFVARAQAANRHFTLDAKNAPAVAEICRRLDGLPLAIELAAARTRLLRADALLARLDHRLGLLTGGQRDLPDRQRTLRGTIDWSYDLLEPDQKTLFDRLGVFVDGFNLEAAEAVCNSDHSLNILEGIEALVNSSLVRTDENEDGTRFSMLETVHEYAYERLEASGELDMIRKQHAAYYLEIMRYLAGFSVSFSNEMEPWLDWIAEEHQNLRAVMRWGQSRPENNEAVLALIPGMGWYWYRRGHLTEGRAWSDWALSTRAAQEVSTRTGMLYALNTIMAMHQGDLQAADNSVEEQLNIGYSTEDDAVVGVGLTLKGMLLTQQGKHDPANAMLTLSRKVAADIKLDFWAVDGLLTQATAALGLGDADGALKLVEEAETISKAIQSDWMTAYAYNLYGEVHRVLGNFRNCC
jgi:predicted ATPase